FFSSRRRHTRCLSDWSSDVCSSDLRFQENSLVYSLVRATVKARLLKENLVPRLEVPVGQPGEPGDVSPRVEPPPGLFSPRQELADRTVAPWELPAGGSPANRERERAG